MAGDGKKVKVTNGGSVEFAELTVNGKNVGELRVSNLTGNRTWYLPDYDTILGSSTGTIWYANAGAPDPALGNSNDFYLDTNTGNVYQKVTSWTLKTNIKGADGVGQPGPPGPANVTTNGNGLPVVSNFDNTTKTLAMKSLVAGANITLDNSNDSIVINSTASGSVTGMGRQPRTDHPQANDSSAGTVVGTSSGNTLQFKDIVNLDGSILIQNGVDALIVSSTGGNPSFTQNGGNITGSIANGKFTLNSTPTAYTQNGGNVTGAINADGTFALTATPSSYVRKSGATGDITGNINSDGTYDLSSNVNFVRNGGNVSGSIANGLFNLFYDGAGSNLQSDPNPTLGANMDTTGHQIGNSTGNMNIIQNAQSDFNITGAKNMFVTSQNGGNISMTAAGGLNLSGGSVAINSATGGSILLLTGASNLSTDKINMQSYGDMSLISTGGNLNMRAKAYRFLSSTSTLLYAMPTTAPNSGQVLTALDAAGTLGWVDPTGGGSAGVSTFNNRSGAVTLSSADVTSAIGYVPAQNGLITSNGNTMPTGTILARTATSTGAIQALTPAQIKTMLQLDQVSNTADQDKPVFTTTKNGTVPAPGAVAGKFLSDNGTWVAVSGGGGGSNNLTGDLQTNGYQFVPGAGNTLNTLLIQKPDTNQDVAYQAQIFKYDASQTVGYSDALGYMRLGTHYDGTNFNTAFTLSAKNISFRDQNNNPLITFPTAPNTVSGQVLKSFGTSGTLVWGSLTAADVGLDQVNNTADADKPVSTAQRTALNAKQNLITNNSLAVNSLVAGTTGQVLTTNSSGQVVWGTGSGGGSGITSVSQDPNPMLGGNLDVNDKYITNSGNNTIIIQNQQKDTAYPGAITTRINKTDGTTTGFTSLGNSNTGVSTYTVNANNINLTANGVLMTLPTTAAPLAGSVLQGAPGGSTNWSLYSMPAQKPSAAGNYILTSDANGALTFSSVSQSGSGWGTTVTATGTGASQNITLPESGLQPRDVLVFVNGIRFATSRYSISGSTLTVTSNASGDSIEVIKPAGSVGPQGPAATISVGTTTTVPPGTAASVTNSGSSSAAVFNFNLPKGDAGPAGSTGATGPAGNAATIAVGTVTTGAAGSSATVTNSGTSSAATFNFTIPQGAQGTAGATGATGNTGATGPVGPGVAAGGTAGQVLSKVDGTDYNTQWIAAPSGTSLPTGGSTGQALVKNSATNNDVKWGNVLSTVSGDTTPTLGGPLTVTGFDVKSSITTNGGNQYIKAIPSVAANAASIIVAARKTDDSGSLASITLTGGANAGYGIVGLNYTPSGTLYGVSINNITTPANNYILPVTAGTAGQVLTASGSTTVAASWTTPKTFLPPRTLVTSTSTTFNCDWSLYDVIEVTIGANCTFTFSGAVNGQSCKLKIKQDATGSRTVTLPTSVRYGTDITSFTATTTASKKDYVGFIYDLADTKYDIVSAAHGY